MSRPAMQAIGAAQREEINLRRQLAARRFYRDAKRLQGLGGALTLALALTAPLLVLWSPDSGPILGAISGLWIFLARLIVRPVRDRHRLMGASAQERFDVDVLGLAANRQLAGSVSEEEIRRASGDSPDFAGVRDWYPTNGSTSWPRSVLICQRANAVWARRQHRSYAIVLLVMASAWFVVGVLVGVAADLSLTTYLASLALPSLPAFLDATDLAKEHFTASDRRLEIESTVDEMLEKGTASEIVLREIQDQLFVLRRDSPLVPEWYYRLVADRYENDMQYAADQLTAGESGHGDDD